MPTLADDTVQATAMVTDQELDAAFKGPAPLVNKFYVTIGGATGRIAFMEHGTPNTVPQFRCAVSMSLTDLVQLRDLLTKMSADFQKFDLTQGAQDGQGS